MPWRFSGGALFDGAIWTVALATIPLVAFIVTPSSSESYRLPKELLVRTAGIVIAALAAVRWLLFGPSARWRPDRRWLFAAVAVGWTAVTALAARQKILAAESLLWVAACALLFVALDAGVAGRWWTLMYAVLFPAAVNAVYCILTMARWIPGIVLVDRRATGFFGNADDVGSYLAFAVVAAVALSIATPRRRGLHVFLAGLLFTGLLTTQTIGAVAAVFAAMAAIAFVAARRRIVTLVTIVAIGLVVVTAYQPFRSRIERWLVAAASGRIDDILSNRGAGILAAWEMTKDRPLLGVGPGCYGFEFYRYKLQVEERHASLAFASTRPYNFGSAHSDHMQTMAQTGLPGYALLLFALFLLSQRSFRPRERGVEGRFGRVASLPLAVAFAVNIMPGFPMELAGPMTVLLAIVVLCTARIDQHATD